MRYLFIIAFVLFGRGIAQEAPSSSALLNYIEEKLPWHGVLKIKDGFVYVDLTDEYIHGLIPFIQEAGFEEPPYFGSGFVGAHITVIYPEEIKKHGLGKIEEVGQSIRFIPKECLLVHPPRWQEVESAYLVKIEAPELSKIRERLRLPPHDFHITIGVKPR